MSKHQVPIVIEIKEDSITRNEITYKTMYRILNVIFT